MPRFQRGDRLFSGLRLSCRGVGLLPCRRWVRLQPWSHRRLDLVFAVRGKARRADSGPLVDVRKRFRFVHLGVRLQLLVDVGRRAGAFTLQRCAVLFPAVAAARLAFRRRPCHRLPLLGLFVELPWAIPELADLRFSLSGARRASPERRSMRLTQLPLLRQLSFAIVLHRRVLRAQGRRVLRRHVWPRHVARRLGDVVGLRIELGRNVLLGRLGPVARPALDRHAIGLRLARVDLVLHLGLPCEATLCQRLLDLHATLFILALLQLVPDAGEQPGAEVAQEAHAIPSCISPAGAAGAAGTPP